MSKITDNEEEIMIKICADIQITSDHRNAIIEWINKIKRDELVVETQHITDFNNIILHKLLGYSREDIKENPSKKFDYEILKDKKPIIAIETKGIKQGNKKYQHRKNPNYYSPEHQLWHNMLNSLHLYGFATNYNEFTLIVRSEPGETNKMIEFKNLKNNDDMIKVFLGLFSKKYLIDGKIPLAKTIIEQVRTKQLEMSKDFYNLFNNTRFLLIDHLDNTTNLSTNDIIYYTQLFLNRMLFIMFVEDKNLVTNVHLFKNYIFGPLENERIQHDTKIVSDNIHEMFEDYKNGGKYNKIAPFNGGLFQECISDKVNFMDQINYKLDIKEHEYLIKHLDIKVKNKINENLNPIIRNLLVLDNYNFSIENSVNLLGYIFEKSLTVLNDLKHNVKVSTVLNDLKHNVKSERKEQGIYYTNKDLTRFCCERTILPFLSKSKNPDVTIDELINEYKNIDELIEKIKTIKIIDPACGSGAFLITAIDLLMNIYHKIDMKHNLDHYNETIELKQIIKNNIYGIDLNRDSIEITKLAIFLKLAIFSNKLPTLSDHIKVGNSLIDDINYDVNAITWNIVEKDEENDDFNKIIKNGGFDIVLGNPPWEKVTNSIQDFFAPKYNSTHKIKFKKLIKTEKENYINDEIKNNRIKRDYNNYVSQTNKNIEYYNCTNSYKFQGRGDKNLYKLFFERIYLILNKKGYCGIVLPSGIYADKGCSELRKLLFKKSKILSLFGFINKNGIFEDVHRQTKFCTLIYTKNGVTDKFRTQFNLVNTRSLFTYLLNGFSMTFKTIENLYPNDLIVVEINNKLEHNVLHNLFKYPKLKDDIWNIQTNTDFHPTNEKEFYHKINVGYELYYGGMIEQFTDRCKSRKAIEWVKIDKGRNKFINTEKRKLETNNKKEKNKIDKSFSKIEIINLKNKIDKKYNIQPKLSCDDYRLVWRDTASSTNYRSLLATIVEPNVFLLNTIIFIKPFKLKNNNYFKHITYDETLFMCGIFNSFLIDWLVRNIINTHVTPSTIKQLPIPKYDENNKHHKTIMQNSAKLICTSKRFDKLRAAINMKENGITDPNKRLGLLTEININSAIIYGLTKNEFHEVLKNFEKYQNNKKLVEKCKIEFDHYLQNI